MLGTDTDSHLSILFTDVEGSTVHWETEKDKMSESLARHDHIVRDMIASLRGHVFSVAGDSFGVIFSESADTLDASRRVLRSIQQEDWSEGVEISVRLSLHSGAVYQRDNGAYGPEIVRAAILCEIGHASQILCTQDFVGKITNVETRCLGRCRLRKISEPLLVHQIVSESFARLRNVTKKVCTVPASRDALIGRQEHTAALHELMDSTRLLSLVVPGGVGKATLACGLAVYSQ
ncbi:MAG: hypothetical protein AAGA11_19950 [Pseudomonadota bacterium]